MAEPVGEKRATAKIYHVRAIDRDAGAVLRNQAVGSGCGGRGGGSDGGGGRVEQGRHGCSKVRSKWSIGSFQV